MENQVVVLFGSGAIEKAIVRRDYQNWVRKLIKS